MKAGEAVLAPSEGQLSPDLFRKMDAWWRAANYLSVGQIYLLGNPLLKQPLEKEDIKPRLLGHWGTTPGLNFIYVHLNRVIKERDLDMMYVIGPGHGGPGIVANTYLEGTYSEVYPNISQDAEGIGSCSSSSRFLAESQATSRPRRLAPSTKAASLAMRSVTPSAPLSIILTSSSRPLSATAKRKPARSPQAGIPTNS